MSRNALRRVRSFIAIELAGGVKHRAAELIKKLKTAEADVKWVLPTEMHVTLNFLGEIQQTDIVPVCKIMREVAANFEPFDVGFSGLGAFPNADEPRILWMGLEESADQLIALQQALETALFKELGFAKERRKYTPHLTLGRVNLSTAKLIAKLDELAEFPADYSDVDELVLFASFLEKGSPVYEPLGHVPIGNAVTATSADDLVDEETDDFAADFRGQITRGRTKPVKPSDKIPDHNAFAEFNEADFADLDFNEEDFDEE